MSLQQPRAVSILKQIDRTVGPLPDAADTGAHVPLIGLAAPDRPECVTRISA